MLLSKVTYNKYICEKRERQQYIAVGTLHRLVSRTKQTCAVFQYPYYPYSLYLEFVGCSNSDRGEKKCSERTRMVYSKRSDRGVWIDFFVLNGSHLSYVAEEAEPG